MEVSDELPNDIREEYEELAMEWNKMKPPKELCIW
jgi:hypothetical protein